MPFPVRVHLGRTAQCDGRPVRLQHPRPVMGPGARFEAAQTRRALGHDRGSLRTSQSVAERHFSCGRDARELKARLGASTPADADLPEQVLLLRVLLYVLHFAPHFGGKGRREEAIPFPLETRCFRGALCHGTQ